MRDARKRRSAQTLDAERTRLILNGVLRQVK